MKQEKKKRERKGTNIPAKVKIEHSHGKGMSPCKMGASLLAFNKKIIEINLQRKISGNETSKPI